MPTPNLLNPTHLTPLWFNKDEKPLNMQINSQRIKLFIRMGGIGDSS